MGPLEVSSSPAFLWSASQSVPAASALRSRAGQSTQQLHLPYPRVAPGDWTCLPDKPPWARCCTWRRDRIRADVTEGERAAGVGGAGGQRGKGPAALVMQGRTRQIAAHKTDGGTRGTR